MRPMDSTALQVGLLLLVLFIPFSYLVDVFMYRAFQRRQAKQGGGTARR